MTLFIKLVFHKQKASLALEWERMWKCGITIMPLGDGNPKSILMQELCNLFNLFLFNQETADHLLYPNPGSGMIHEQHLQFFHFLGTVLGKVWCVSSHLCHFFFLIKLPWVWSSEIWRISPLWLVNLLPIYVILCSKHTEWLTSIEY